MQVKTISYRRVKNLGNYQSETLEMSVELEESDEPLLCAKKLKALVLRELELEDWEDLDKIDF